MSKFIRIDKKGTWRGTEHQSRTACYEWSEDERQLEDGISCYNLNEEGIKDLFNYINNNMSLSEEDLKNSQITIFEGEWNGNGSDGEELAWCKETVAELEANEWWEAINEATEKLEGFFENEDGEYEDEISEEEFNELILKATGLN